MSGSKADLSQLPEDLPPVKGLKTQVITPGDYRKGLTPGKDRAVYATKAFPADTVLGVYRCIAITDSEESDMKHTTPEEYCGCNAQWRQGLDMYAAEISAPSPCTWGKRLLQEVFDAALQVRIELHSVSLYCKVLQDLTCCILRKLHCYAIFLPIPQGYIGYIGYVSS